MGDDKQWQQRLHQKRGAVDDGDNKQPGYRAASYQGTALRATVVPGATAGCKVVAALGVADLGWQSSLSIQSCGEEEDIWDSFSQIPTKSAASSACFMNDCRNLNPRE